MEEFIMFRPMGEMPQQPASMAGGRKPFPTHTPLAMAFIPFQQGIQNMYSPQKGLQAGTMFPDLDKPFTGRKPR